jgi:flagellar hook-basal body protein
MSFYTSLTGLNAATTQLSVTSNNIANSGTGGFKRSEADFGDIFATSPLEKSSSVIGRGVSLKEVSQEFSQGNIENSANALDLAIAGDGFFALESSDGTKVYTRNGAFMLNEQNQMVNSSGQALQSLPVDSTNKADFSQDPSAMTIPRKTVAEFNPTTEVELGLNLPAQVVPITEAFNPNNPDTYHKTTSLTVYGTSGSANLATIYYVKTQNASADDPNNKWQTHVYITDDSGQAQAIDTALIQKAENAGDEMFINKYGEIKSRSELQQLQRTSTESDKYLITQGTLYKKYSFDKLAAPTASLAAAVQLSDLSGTANIDALNLTNGSDGFDFSGYTREQLKDLFAMSIDGSSDIKIGLEHLAGSDVPRSGTQIAQELENVLNSRFGDSGRFDYTAAASQFLGICRYDNAGEKAADLNIVTSDLIEEYMRGGTIPLDFDDVKFGTDLTISDGLGNDYAVEFPLPAAPAAGAAVGYTDVEKAGILNDAAQVILTAINTAAVATSPFTVAYSGTATAAGALTLQYNDSFKLEPDADALVTDPPTEFRLPPAVKPIFSLISKALTAEQSTERTGEAAAIAAGVATPLNSQLNDSLMSADDDGVLSDFIQPENLAVALNAKLSQTAGFEDVEISWDYARVGWRVVQTGDNVGQINFSNQLARTGAGTELDPYVYPAADAASVNPLWGAGGGVVPTTYDVTNTSGGTTSSVVDTDLADTIISVNAPTAALTAPVKDQRFGINVEYKDNNFIFSSGTTGDTSSISMKDLYPNASLREDIGKSALNVGLFGFDSGDQVVAPNVSLIENKPAERGIASQAASIIGNTMGVDARKAFLVNDDNRSLTVIIDGISKQIQLDKGSYSIGLFTTHLEEQINLMGDSLGRTVSGINVSYSEAQGAIAITGSTATSDSFIQIAGHSDFGFENVEPAFGSSSSFIELESDTSGTSQLYVKQNAEGEWVETTDGGEFSESNVPYWTPIFLDRGELTFSTAGTIVSPNSKITLKSADVIGGTVDFDYQRSTQFNSPFSVLSQTQNGRPEGDLVGVSIGDNGLVEASYSNGSQKSLGKILIANFATPKGLRQIGDTTFSQSSKSGNAVLDEPGAAGYGTIRAGARERSNVDLTSELVDLITAQRNFQANAKAIETSSSLTQTIINIRG